MENENDVQGTDYSPAVILIHQCLVSNDQIRCRCPDSDQTRSMDD